MHVQGVQGGRSSECTYFMDDFIITGLLNFIFDVFQACHIFYCRAKRKILPFVLWKAKLPKNLPDALAFCLYTARTFKAITNCNIFTFRHFDWEPFNGKNLHNVYVKIKIFFEPKTILT